MKRGFFDKADGIPGPPSWVNELAVTASSFQIRPSQNGFLFSNQGASAAVTFNLPAIRPGYYFGFMAVADRNLTVQSTTASMLVRGIGNGTSVSFNIPGDIVGAKMNVYANFNGTIWIVEFLSNNSYSVTFP